MTVSDEYYRQLESLLSPWENVLVWIQVTLSWRFPVTSLISVLCAETFLIYICFLNDDSIFLFLLLVWIVLFFDFIHSYLWPNIKVPEVTDQADSWTTLSPGVMNVYEISHRVANWLAMGTDWLNSLSKWRQERRVPFCLLFVVMLSFGAYLGTFVTGRTLFFLSANLVLWTPALLRFRVAEHLYSLVGPWWEKFKREMDRQELQTTLAAEAEEAQFHPDVAQWERVLETELRAPTEDTMDEEYIQKFLPTPNAPSSTQGTKARIIGGVSDEDDDMSFELLE